MAFSRSFVAIVSLATILACIPVIQAAAVAADKASPNGSNPPVARSWISSMLSDSETTTAATTSTSATATDATAYLRIASLSIALYDFMMTIPGEFRLYASQPSLKKMSRACVLFILVRYISVAALVTSNVGFFGSNFSASACSHFYLVAPILKVFAVLVSQAIVSVRTYAISRKEPWVLYFLSALFVACMVPEFLGNAWERIAVQNSSHNCTSGNGKVKVAWLHYLAAMIYDVATMAISTTYLVLQSTDMGLMSGLSRLMLKEGMVFFILLTGVNLLNLVLFRVGSLAAQSSAASLGQAVTMIMSQHIILSLHNWRAASTNSPSSHELGPVSYAGHAPTHNGHDNSVMGRLRNMGHNGNSRRDGGKDGFHGTTSVTFNADVAHRQSRTVGTMPSISDQPTTQSRSVVRDFVRTTRKGSSENETPLEIRIEVQEDIKMDDDALSLDPNDHNALAFDQKQQTQHWSRG
ncbi:hypothetical protein DL93DRAFT_2073226 [Clavulina sp. PMI_390]|nr:hypothetical protein DL93DRAFT_2073226 [Clavulina sp. PMI_390]